MHFIHTVVGAAIVTATFATSSVAVAQQQQQQQQPPPPPPGGYDPQAAQPYPYAQPYAQPYPQPAPVAYREEVGPNVGLIAGGAGLLGGVWLINVVSAVGMYYDRNPNADQTAPIMAPVVGPFIALGTLYNTNAGGGIAAVLLLDGAAQLAGLGMIIGGAVTTRKRMVRAGDPPSRIPEVRFTGAGTTMTWRF